MPKPLTFFRLFELVRDSRCTKNAQRLVLIALVQRCNPAKSYVCWPSYALLSEDTGLNIQTVKRATRALQDAGLIHRKQRPNRSNIFYVNVGLLQQQAAAATPSRNEEVDEESPFEPPIDDNQDELEAA